MPRRRVVYFLLILCIIPAGLFARHLRQAEPSFITEYAADTLWPILFFLIFGWLLPTAKTWTIAALALALTCAIEFSQLYHGEWLEPIRATQVGGFLLGSTFLWSDIACLFVGTAFAAAMELLWLRRRW